MRTSFLVSDHTGITVDTLAHSLLSQFPGIEIRRENHSFVSSAAEVDRVVEDIDAAARDGETPLVFCTLVDPALRERVHRSAGICVDVFDSFLPTLERALGVTASSAVGLLHGVGNDQGYQARLEAIDYAMGHDDGTVTRDYDRADVILVGVSRTGKTPTSLYLAMQFGIKAANYPLTEEDFGIEGVPEALHGVKSHLFGLTTDADRLQRIRQQRRPGGTYSSLAQCQHEVREAEALFRRANIPSLNTAGMSIEEIATAVVARVGLRRNWRE
jgi:regulator of PEP synthase PpsR (kinase-PPPase family)